MSWLGILAIAYTFGKIISLVKLPSILGWLIAGMVFGPYMVGLVSSITINETWYLVIEKTVECLAGVMIGSEMIVSKLRKYGKSIIVTTLFQSIGTFFVVSVVFLCVFAITKTPLYLAPIFGGIALATAPAPALSIVKQYRTKGPITDTLLPMAALDDIVGIIIFFTVITIVSITKGGGEGISIWKTVCSIVLPIVIGSIIGFLGGLIARKTSKKWSLLLSMIVPMLIAAACGIVIDLFLFGSWMFNYLLAGMCVSALMSNMVGEEKLQSFLHSFDPVLSICLIVVIVNLGMPLNYKTIAGAGLFTLVYIVARAFGKYGGAYLGSSVSKAPTTVKKYLGFTLLPHSGVSLVFTGIAVTTLSGFDPDSAQILQGTIASAAIINEIIAVILARQGFKWGGELPIDKKNTEVKVR